MSTRLLAYICVGVAALMAGRSQADAGSPNPPPQKCFEDSEVVLDAGVVDAITADVDGDGRDDLLALQPPMLNILRNDGENFLPYQSINVGDGITKIAAGHINKDNAPDIGILRGDELVIYINTGSGYSAKPTNVIPTAASPVQLIFADLDDDGDDDAVTTHTGLGQINAILLTPGGELQSESTLFNLTGVKKTIVANLNGDALLDLAAISDANAQIVFNRGSSQFDTVTVTFPQTTQFKIYEIIAADFAPGGFDEPVIIFEARLGSDPRLAHSYLVSISANEILSYDLTTLYQEYNDHSALAAVDQDGDGDLDIWLGGQSGAGVPVFLLENDGGHFLRRAGADGFYHPDAILPLRMNAKHNLLVLDRGFVKLLRNEFGALFRTLNYELLSDDSHLVGLSAGDLNRDGADDLIAFTVNGIFVHWGGDRRSWSPQLLVPGSYGYGSIVDFNGDGLLDIAGFGDTCRIFFQQIDGTFQLGAEVEDGQIVELGDINNDGRIDLVTKYDCAIYVQQSDGTFFRTLSGCGTSFGCVYGSLLGDMNGDGFDDYVRRYELCLNYGDGTFGQSIPYDDSGTTFPSVEKLGDIDNDGDLDFIFQSEFCCANRPGFYIYLNDGHGNLTRAPTPDGFGPPSSVSVSLTLIDVDGDGVRDFVHGTSWEGGEWYEHGNGDGTLTGVQGWNCGYMGFISLRAVGDFDGDGALDLAGVAVDSDWSSLQYLARVYGTCVVNCREDTNHDGRVGVADLFKLLSEWGHCPSCFSDLDGDDFVGQGDLNMLFQHWGSCED